MSHPLASALPPGLANILFSTEGNPVAVLVTSKAGRRVKKHMRFSQAKSALAWCRDYRAVLVHFPAMPDRN